MAKTRNKTRPAPAPTVAPALVAERPWTLWSAAIVLASIGVIPMSNLVTTGRSLGWWPSAVEQWVAWSAGLLSIALLVARMLPHRVDRVTEFIERVLLTPPRWAFMLITGLLTCLLAVYFGWRLFALQPVVGDEFAQRWQAHLLTSGRLFARTPQAVEFFSTSETLDVAGRWFAQFPMGGPAVLAMGALVGVPWLVNPLMAALTAGAVYLFASAIGNEITARGTAVLFALCPFVLFMAGSEMNHVSALAFCSFAMAALPRWWKADSRAEAMRAGGIIGGCLAVAATIRPFDAAVVGVAMGVFQLWGAARRRVLLSSLLVQVAAGLIPMLLLVAANRATLGDPFSFAYDVLNGVEHRPGFHMTPLGFEHTPRRGLYNISAYLMKLDVGLLAWPVPAVLVVVITLLLQRRATAWDNVMLGIVVLLLTGYTTYWSLSYFLGPRFLFTAVPALLLYTARLPSSIRERSTSPTIRRAALLLIPMWLLVAWTVPPADGRLVGVREMEQIYRTHATAPAIVDAVQRSGLSNAVVFVPEGWHAQLAARLRALSMRPLLAEQVVAQSDACAIQQVLDTADRLPSADINGKIGLVVTTLRADPPATPLANLLPSDQVALVPQRALAPACQANLTHVLSYGVSMAEMLPYEQFDRDGALTGNVIYARDFGSRDQLLRGQFADRAFYLARITRSGDALDVRLEPLQ